MKFILIGNYPPDKQESMERFALMLQDGFRKSGIQAEVWNPVVFFAKFSKSTITGVGKWLGYIDKWILFPLIIRKRLLGKGFRSGAYKFHVCDHSNAFYLRQLPVEQAAITCHDVLAIRGALGYADAFCNASSFGKIMQKWILRNLVGAKKLATVSGLTLNQLKDLAPADNSRKKNWGIIYNGFNAFFRVMNQPEIDKLLSGTSLHSRPFLLHVGSDLPRKNRRMLLDMVHELGDKFQGMICFAGAALEPELLSYAGTLGLSERVVNLVKPDHDTLVALYNACEAFVFPSFSEGFGWPVIEAQACGAPVIASITAPMPEVSGGAALHADPLNPSAFAQAFIALQNPVVRTEKIELGFKNCERFAPEKMIGAYLKMHEVQA